MARGNQIASIESDINVSGNGLVVNGRYQGEK